ncbi:noncompact myelin-associated protein isoform X1 [Ursus americanus]|uniref:noncompact myelin-associated protein isoform X1 n=1 Tax=Ursus americanus TaxID=9643 RepID=UPI000E6DD7E6|nr:noncompact myelin-associated protein isoform X1 [Ursus americanus]
MTLCPLRRTAAHLKGGLHPELGTRKVTLKGLRRTQCPGGLGQLHYWIEMTTATPLGGTTFFSLNVTTREEDFLYKSSGAIVAAIVVIVIVIFTVVLILLKMYNRKMRTRRELEPKGPKPASPSALGPNNNSSQHPATVTFSPVDVHVDTR